jgi:hypothetical protein
MNISQLSVHQNATSCNSTNEAKPKLRRAMLPHTIALPWTDGTLQQQWQQRQASTHMSYASTASTAAETGARSLLPQRSFQCTQQTATTRCCLARLPPSHTRSVARFCCCQHLSQLLTHCHSFSPGWGAASALLLCWHCLNGLYDLVHAVTTNQRLLHRLVLSTAAATAAQQT